MKFFEGCMNGCLFEIFLLLVLGLCLALVWGAPEIAAWLHL